MPRGPTKYFWSFRSSTKCVKHLNTFLECKGKAALYIGLELHTKYTTKCCKGSKLLFWISLTFKKYIPNHFDHLHLIQKSLTSDASISTHLYINHVTMVSIDGQMCFHSTYCSFVASQHHHFHGKKSNHPLKVRLEISLLR